MNIYFNDTLCNIFHLGLVMLLLFLMISVGLINLTPYGNNCVVVDYVIPIEVYSISSVLINILFVLVILFSYIMPIYSKKFVSRIRIWFWIQIVGRIIIFIIGIVAIFKSNFNCDNVTGFELKNLLIADWILELLYIPFVCHIFKLYRSRYVVDMSNLSYENYNTRVNICCC